MRENGNGVHWDTTTVVDQAAVDRESTFGAVPGAGEIVRIRVAQRLEYDLLSDPITVQVHPVTLHIGDSEFSVAQGRAARDALNAAVEFAEQAENDHPPGPKSE